jgi:23S rRNA (uracil1939-C5)-methyltransferase
MNDQTLSVGDQIEVKTERLTYGGEAIARFQGLAIFIPLAAPLETLRVRITERKKSFARAVIEAILIPSPIRIEPRCRYFGACGGCQLQHIRYEDQLQAKVGFIRDALQRTGKLDWPEEIEIYSAAEFNYRLRARMQIESDDFHISKVGGKDQTAHRKKQQAFKIGFHKANSHSVCDVEQCDILLPELNEALVKIRSSLKSSGNFDHSIQEFELAVSEVSGTVAQGTNKLESISAYPPVASFRNARVERLVAGAVYQFDPSSFFQANALLLDDFVKQAVGTETGKLAIDLYAGVGLFTVQLARRFHKVLGVEANQKAVRYAKNNFALNRIENAEMVCEKADLWLKRFAGQTNSLQPDLVVLDPPRSGAAEAIEPLAKLEPPRIHYISCDPMTLARDLKTLVRLDYQIERIVAFDLFPQTYHVETIAYLKKV